MRSTVAFMFLCLAGLGVANHPQSVPPAKFKAAFEEAGIVPEVIATLNPVVSFYATYTNQDGVDKLLTPGVTLIPSEAAFPKEFSVENVRYVPNITADSRFLIYILDADAPDRNYPTARNLRHYLGGNYTLTGEPSILASAPTLVTDTDPFTPFIQPAPSSGTGTHRYIMALYAQPERFDNAGFESAGMNETRENWNLTAWRTQLGLGPALGATFFQINTDPDAEMSIATDILSSLLGLNTLSSTACLFQIASLHPGVMLHRVFAFGRDRWDPTHRFETSWLLPPWALFAFRALFALYAFTTIFFRIGWGCTHPSSTHDTAGDGGPTNTAGAPAEVEGERCGSTKASFSFFTVLTYWGIAFYLLAAAVHTATYARNSTSRGPLLARFPRPLQALHSLLYTTVTTYPLLVTIVYWAVLYPTSFGAAGGFPNAYTAWSNASQHALNSLFALFEIFVPRTQPPPLVHLWWLIVILALYLGLAYVTLATQGFYVYPFLNPAETAGGRRGVTAYIFGILAAVIVVFGIVWGVIWVRRWVTEEKMGCKGKFAGGVHGRGVDPADPEMGMRAETGA
ncbi:hypothetical protein DL767_005270 [Monosporascus sp. MG133]|nr:hypothetical protein DL767_005270 [Monosporascus sp. MG133]